MASSDDFADEALALVVEAGGSWWFGLLDLAPADDLSSLSLLEDVPPVELARDSAAWVVANRQANPANPISLDTSGLSDTVVPLGWCLFDDEACTLPRIAGRLVDIKVTPGSVVNVPVQTVTIRYPAAVADLL